MAVDYASLYNVSTDSAMTKFESALVGSVRPIRSEAGYDITETTIGQKAKELGVETPVRNLTQMEKRLLRIIVLMDQMKKTGAMGDFARTIEQPSNQLKILQNQLKELGIWIGNVFINSLGRILPYVNGFVMALKEMIKLLAIFFGYENTGSLTEPLEVGTENVNNNLNNAVGSAKELKKILMGFDVLNVIQTPSASSGGVGDLGQISPEILNALEEYDNIMDNVRMKAIDIRNTILEWLGFTWDLDDAGNIVNLRLEDGWTNIEKIWGIIKTIGMSAAIIKIISFFKKMAGLWAAFKVSKIGTWLFNLGAAFKAAANGSSAATSAITFLTAGLTKLLTVAAGVIAVFNGISGISNSYDKALEGEETSTGETVVDTLGIVGGATAIGTVIAPGIGTAIGFLIGLVTSLTTATVGYFKTMDEAYDRMAEENIFGALSVDTKDWLEALGNGNATMNTLADTISNLKSEIESYNTMLEGSMQFLFIESMKSLVSEYATPESVEAFKNSLDTLANSSIEILEKDANTAMELWGTIFEEADGIITDEEKQILKTIQSYSKDQQKEIKLAQDNITKTYDKAIAERGYLTDEEYNYIKTQLQKIKELTQKELSTAETNMEYYAQQLADGTEKITKESYNNLQSALETFEKESEETRSTIYNEARNNAEKLLANEVVTQEQYNKLIAEASETRVKQAEETQAKIDEVKKIATDNLLKQYGEVYNKTDEVSVKMREKLEALFTELNIDPTEYIEELEKNGSLGAMALMRGISKNLKPIEVGVKDDLENKGENAAKNFTNGWNLQMGKSYLSVPEIKYTNPLSGETMSSKPSIRLSMTGAALWKPYATGGFPSIGEMFVAREAGPELVGTIGNKNAVVNNQQIVESVSQGVASAVASVMGSGNGNMNVYIDGQQITDVVVERMARMANITGGGYVYG